MRGKLAIFDKQETRRGELSQCALINLIQAQEPITFRFFPNYRLEESTVFACVRRNLSSPVRRPRREGIDFLGDQRFSVSRSLALYYPSSTRPLAIIRAYRITTYSHFPLHTKQYIAPARSTTNLHQSTRPSSIFHFFLAIKLNRFEKKPPFLRIIS